MDGLDWKDKLAKAFDIDPETVNQEEEVKIDENEGLPAKQNLKIMLDKRNRKGKAVTLIVDFVGSDEALKDLAKELKSQCGSGGSSRGGEILIQGDFRTKLKDILIAKGYKVKVI